MFRVVYATGQWIRQYCAFNAMPKRLYSLLELEEMSNTTNKILQ